MHISVPKMLSTTVLVVCLTAFHLPLAFTASTTCGGKKFENLGLFGYGTVSSSDRDKYGDTISFGSSFAIDKSSWRFECKKRGKDHKGHSKCVKSHYTGTAWGLPDRGWNMEGTINYQPRVHKFAISFSPDTVGKKNLQFKYKDTVLLYDFKRQPFTGLDPNTQLNYTGKPSLPASKYTGDGFGGDGPGGIRASLDPEGMALSSDGGFIISDEYGPYIYKFSKRGILEYAIAPPLAFIPYRKNVVNFSSSNPPRYDPTLEPSPVNPESGRANNQGFEGLTMTPSGRHFFVALQSATIQDGGTAKTTNRYSRILRYSRSNDNKHFKKGGNPWKLTGEFVIALPQYVDPTRPAEQNPRTAAQSALYALSDTSIMILSRDSDAGQWLKNSESQYRQMDVLDISKATNIHGKYDGRGESVSPNGVLKPGINKAEYCPFIDINDNNELSKFGLHNGGAQDSMLLGEKWESIAVVPRLADNKDRKGTTKEYFVFTVSDNDFMTQDGYYGGGKYRYSEAGGADLDTTVLVFKVRL